MTMTGDFLDSIRPLTANALLRMIKQSPSIPYKTLPTCIGITGIIAITNLPAGDAHKSLEMAIADHLKTERKDIDLSSSRYSSTFGFIFELETALAFNWSSCEEFVLQLKRGQNIYDAFITVDYPQDVHLMQVTDEHTYLRDVTTPEMIARVEKDHQS